MLKNLVKITCRFQWFSSSFPEKNRKTNLRTSCWAKINNIYTNSKSSKRLPMFLKKIIFLRKLSNMNKVIFISIIAGLCVISCTPKSVPTAETGESGLSDKRIQGKTIFENSCGTCHDLPNPTAFSSVQWVGIMNAMAPKAKLTDEQHQLVYDYVVSVKK